MVNSGSNDFFLITGAYFLIGSLYLVVIPLFIYFWMSTRWNYMGKFERLFIYSIVFIFFPGFILLAPFLNLRMNGQGDI